MPDGLYNISIRSYDAFDVASPVKAETPLETCALSVDQSHPTIRLDIANFTLVDQTSDTLKVGPGANLNFVVDDRNSVDIFTCLKQRRDETVAGDGCLESEFIKMGSSFNVPDQGAWDLYAFGKDRSGNRSPTILKPFLSSMRP
ncbi:hypothetical protein [Oligoflexus sp.]|uniref:hypothetical protein n=1 Tax=Oligoflexus sp. TaxID=1971216 RepID=UPI002D76A115|nr:hypothetical protein [Oligoflexus sp.]